MANVWKLNSKQIEKGGIHLNFLPLAIYKRSGGYTQLEVAEMKSHCILRLSDFEEFETDDDVIETHLVNVTYLSQDNLHLVQNTDTKELHLYNDIEGDTLFTMLDEGKVGFGPLDIIKKEETNKAELKLTNPREITTNDAEDEEYNNIDDSSVEDENTEYGDESYDGIPDEELQQIFNRSDNDQYDESDEGDPDQYPIQDDGDVITDEEYESMEKRENETGQEKSAQKPEIVPAEKHRIGGSPQNNNYRPSFNNQPKLSKKERKQLEKEQRRNAQDESHVKEHKSPQTIGGLRMPSGFNASVFEALIK